MPRSRTVRTRTAYDLLADLPEDAPELRDLERELARLRDDAPARAMRLAGKQASEKAAA